MAARLSEQLGVASSGLEAAVTNIFIAAKLPTQIPQFSAEDWLDAMGHDKKNIGSLIRYILLRDIGDAYIAEDVTDSNIRQLIASFARGSSH